MSKHLIEFESETITYEDATLTLHKIKGRSKTLYDSTPIHTHSYFELLLVIDGAYICHTEKGDIHIQAGEMLIIEPTLQHRAFCDDTAPHMAVLGISISAPRGKGRFYEYFTSFLQTHAGMPLPLRKSVFHKFVDYYLSPTRYTIRQLCERKREACDLITALLDMAEDSTSASITPTTAPDIVLETLVNSADISLSEIAAQLGYSTRQVQRKIRAQYGKSLREIRSAEK